MSIEMEMIRERLVEQVVIKLCCESNPKTTHDLMGHCWAQYRLTCGTCGRKTRPKDTLEEAIEAWNKEVL